MDLLRRWRKCGLYSEDMVLLSNNLWKLLLNLHQCWLNLCVCVQQKCPAFEKQLHTGGMEESELVRNSLKIICTKHCLPYDRANFGAGPYNSRAGLSAFCISSRNSFTDGSSWKPVLWLGIIWKNYPQISQHQLYMYIYCEYIWAYLYLLVSLFMEQLAQVVQAAGDWTLVSMGVLEVLVWDVGTGQEGALGLIHATLIHLYDSCVQVGRWGERKSNMSPETGLHSLTRSRCVFQNLVFSWSAAQVETLT